MAQDTQRSRVNALAVITSSAFGVANLFIGLSTRLLNSQTSTDHESKAHR